MMAEQLEIEYKKVEGLIPFVNNSRTHSEEQVNQIASSIREFGFTNPILLDGENGVIAGHGRLQAARLLGLDEVPTITLSGLTELQKRAYVIADNKLALNAGWDSELLEIEVKNLSEQKFDLGVLGFDEKELELLLKEIEISDFPELPTGEKQPFQQKTFTLHDEQASIVDDAIMLARTNPLVDTGLNENSNGNALALICEQWLAQQNAD